MSRSVGCNLYLPAPYTLAPYTPVWNSIPLYPISQQRLFCVSAMVDCKVPKEIVWVQVMDDMQGNGVLANAITYSAAIGACDKGG